MTRPRQIVYSASAAPTSQHTGCAFRSLQDGKTALQRPDLTGDVQVKGNRLQTTNHN